MTLIPNSFQHPNAYVDWLSYYLTGEEEKVLNKAIREILGWHNKIASRRARIALSIFVNGKEVNGEQVCMGCGLSIDAVRKALKALHRFNILVKTGAPTSEGQEYELIEDWNEVQWDTLRRRREKWDAKNKCRTQKARGVLSDSRQGYCQTVGPGVLSDSNKETQASLETQEKPPSPGGEGPEGENDGRAGEYHMGPGQAERYGSGIARETAGFNRAGGETGERTAGGKETGEEDSHTGEQGCHAERVHDAAERGQQKGDIRPGYAQRDGGRSAQAPGHTRSRPKSGVQQAGHEVIGQGFSVGKLLRSTMTQGESDPVPKSKLALYIEQQMHSPVPNGQLNKLALGYTEQLGGGQTQKHPSPDVLWESNPRYPEYVKERIKYYKGQSGSPAARRSKLINALCAYKGGPYAWLEWSEGETESRPKNLWDAPGYYDE